MNISELKFKLEEIGVPRRVYSLGTISDERVCLLCRDTKWYVIFYERGHEKILGSFESENFACEFMLKELKYEL